MREIKNEEITNNRFDIDDIGIVPKQQKFRHTAFTTRFLLKAITGTIENSIVNPLIYNAFL
ncbi:MAG: hypothetical protein J6W12_06090 [Bacteroidales bacterium]|nr:hypothetical protein [Bacteroidales bacterium]